jgi:biopolymer transport protein ExbD
MNENYTLPELPKHDSWARATTFSLLAFKYILAAAFLFGPPIYLAYHPTQYTPVVDTLFSVLLFLLAYWIGRDVDIEKARQEASEKWLPQAEAVTYRLMTLFGNVRGFANKMARNCGEASCDLPELQKDEMKGVRIKLKADCNAASDRLADIANQLEDAVGDWQRFIAANCRGQECYRIFAALEERRARIMQQDSELQPGQAETRAQ